MVSKQQLIKEIIENLKRTSLFDNDLKIEGDLCLEGNSLTIKYKNKEDISQRIFEVGRADLESRIEHTLIRNHPVNIEISKEENYYLISITRYPLEGVDDPTIEVLKTIKKEVDEYLFKRR